MLNHHCYTFLFTVAEINPFFSLHVMWFLVSFSRPFFFLTETYVLNRDILSLYLFRQIDSYARLPYGRVVQVCINVFFV